MNQRLRDHRRAHRLYTLKFRDWPNCVYCGEMAELRDHVFPLKAAAMMLDYDGPLTNNVRRSLVLVPACASCNAIGSDRVFNSLGEKRRFIQMELRVRLQRLAAPRWDDDELDELGHMLRSYVVSKQAELDRLARRAYWPKPPPSKRRFWERAA